MDYQARMRVIVDRLNDFLRLFERPRHLDDKLALAETRSIAEEVNSAIPAYVGAEALDNLLSDVFRRIRRSQTTRAWPTVARFAQETRAALSDAQSSSALPQTPSDFTLDPLAVTARRMNAGEPVGEAYLWGTRAVELLGKGLVSQEVMDRYRKGAFFTRREIYGHEAASAWERGAVERHQAAMASQAGVS